MIDINKIHPAFKNRIFRYSPTINVDQIKNGENPETKHMITSKERGRGKQWQFVGGDNGPFLYPSEEAAKQDVQKLNDWAAS